MSSFGIDALGLSGAEASSLKEFVASWERHSWPVLFAGAGFSFNGVRKPGARSTSKFGSWEDLLNDIRDRLANEDPDVRKRLSTDPLRLAQIFEKHSGRAALLDLVFKHVPNDDFVPGEAHHKLRSIRWSAIVTTNYDDLIERAYEHRRTVRRVLKDEDLTQQRSLSDLLVLKLHGDLRDRETIVLTEEDYRRYPIERPGISVKVRQLLTEHPILFTGFSLSDPHFAMIDGWIRDTVHRLRLPAVAIMHSPPVPAERAMWHDRGVTTVLLPKNYRLEHLFGGLAQERTKLVFRNRKAPDREGIWQVQNDARAIATEQGTGRAVKLAEQLKKLIALAGPRQSRNPEALDAIRWFAWGWHDVLQVGHANPNDRRAGQDIAAGDVYDLLSPGEKRELLLLALEAGAERIALSRTTSLDSFDALASTEFTLTRDETAHANLAKARIERENGDSRSAHARALEARTAAESLELRSEISEEIREILFQEGDAQRISEELQRPLEETLDGFAMCRRGADHLLLGQRDAAQHWYLQALESAADGDEQYAALWGVRASSFQLFPSKDGEEAKRREENFRSELSAIPEDERPLTRDALALVDRAGRLLLDDAHKQSVADPLLSFLKLARHMGWPHSPEHSISYVIETAARRASRLLCAMGGSDRDGGDGARDGIPLLSRYGLARETTKTFTTDVVERLARSSADVEWFRRFAIQRPSLPRSVDAHLMATLRGIAVLEDSAIADVVAEVATRVRDWIAAKKKAETDVLRDCVELIRESQEHLPREAAKAAFQMLVTCVADRAATLWLEPSFSLQFWCDQGFLSSGSEQARVLGEALVAAAANLGGQRDPRWLLSITAITVSAAEAGLIDHAVRLRLQAAVMAELTKLVDDGAKDAHAITSLAEILDALDQDASKPSLKAFASVALRIVQGDRRSSALGNSMYLASLAVVHMNRTDQRELLKFASDYAVSIGGSDTEFDHVGSLGVLFEALARRFPRVRPELANSLGRIAERAPAALRAYSRLGGQATTSNAVRFAMGALLSERPQARSLRSIAAWLATAPKGDVSDLVSVVIGLSASESRDVRFVAVLALEDHARAIDKPLDDSVFAVLSAVAENDPSYFVRARALRALRIVKLQRNQLATYSRLAARAATSNVAVERRLAPLLPNSGRRSSRRTPRLPMR